MNRLRNNAILIILPSSGFRLVCWPFSPKEKGESREKTKTKHEERTEAMDGVGKEKSDMEKTVRTWVLNAFCTKQPLLFL